MSLWESCYALPQAHDRLQLFSEFVALLELSAVFEQVLNHGLGTVLIVFRMRETIW
jgi:hypothetical protein